MRAYERFIEYAKIWTTSEWNRSQEPSSMRQFDLAHQLAFELREMGLQQVMVDNHCFVYASLPASQGCENRPVLGLLAHLDTHPDCPGRNVRPQLIEHYDGSDVALGDSGLVLHRSEFPHLASLIGQTLITSDGRTLLGVDGKAGIAEIMTALEQLIESPRPHGPVSIAFLADEEIGSGTAHFDLERFGAKYAYTVDGWEAGEIVTETFNGMQATVNIQGVTTHTGRGKGILINAQLAALEFASMLPPDEIPALTEGREGFFHLLRSNGTVDAAKLVYNLRDFTDAGMTRRINLLKQAAHTLNVRYGAETVQLSFKEEYRNMHDKLKDYPQLIQNAEAACRLAGIEPKLSIARGGTNGARLSFAGLPCPNLGIGGWAYHSPHEHTTVEIMDQVTLFLKELIYRFAEEQPKAEE